MSFPPEGSASRSVLVTNIPTRASEQDIENFFSFCGAITDKRIKVVPPATHPDSNEPTLEAYVIFESESARTSALLLDGSSLSDRRVKIAVAPEQWTEHAPSAQNNGAANGAAANSQEQNLFVFLPAPAAGALNATAQGIGGLFNDVTHVLSEEAKKVEHAWKESNDHGVLKKARDQANATATKTKETAAGIDEKFGVKNKVNVAKTKAQEIAGTVVNQTKAAASSVDEKLHVSDKANDFASKAMENEMIANGYNTIMRGWNSMWQNQSASQPNRTPESNDNADPTTQNSEEVSHQDSGTGS